MKKLICVFLIFLNLTFVICNLSLASEYLLGPNDTLEICIVDHKNLDTKQAITPDGQISLPMLGIIPVEGKTLNNLQKYLSDSYSHYLDKPQVTINLTPRPIYVVQYNLKNDIWEVKSAKSIDEANAYAGGAAIPAKAGIQDGNVYKVTMGTKPDFWESNWYKVITATAVMVGIYSTMHK